MAARGGIGALTVALGLDAAEFSSGLTRAEQESRRFANNYKKNFSTANQANTQLNAQILDLGGSLKRLGAAGIAGGTLLSIGKMADEYTKFSAQLKLATRDQAEFAAGQTAINRIATTGQADIGAVTTLYARLANALHDQGVAQTEIADITETATLALKVNGATATESASALLQLSQAFGSGVLRGEEFNAVNEAAPALLRQVAREMGVQVGQLKNLAAEGKITTEVLRRALTDPQYLDDLRRQAQLVQTIGGSFTVLNNTLLNGVGAFDKATGASKLLASGIDGVAKSLQILIDLASGQPIDYSKYLPNGGKPFTADATGTGGILGVKAKGNLPDSRARIDDTAAKEEVARFDKLRQSFEEFAKANPLKDAQEAGYKYAQALAAINAAQAGLIIGEEEASRRRKQAAADFKSATTVKKAAAAEENKIATALANTNANLLKSAIALNQPDASPAERLQRELDAFATVTPAIRAYTEEQIKLRQATDALNEEDERRAANAKQFISDQQDLISRGKSLTEAVDGQAAYNAKIKEYYDLLKAGTISQDTFDLAITQAGKDLEDFGKKGKDEFTDLKNAIDGFGKDAARSITDFIFGTKASFGDMVTSILKDIARLAIQKSITDPISSALSAGISGSGGIGSYFASFFGGMNGARATGGPVSRNGSYLVGERGPELFTPSTNGKISQGTGGSTSVTINVSSGGSSSQGSGSQAAELGKQLEQAVRKVLTNEKRSGGLLA